MATISWSDRSIVGFVFGLVAGLVLATAVALYITKSPMPFLNKVQRPTENVNPGAGGGLKDPNRPLYSNSSQAPAPSIPPAPSSAATAGAASGGAPAGPTARPSDAPAPAASEESSRLMLQAGAFKSSQDADAMRARLALLGLDARVTQFSQDSATVLYRVRIGPFGALDDLAGIRRTLAENGIEAQVVHTQ
jgi:cell division protein FtsN